MQSHLSEEKQQKAKEQACMRAQRYREKQRAEGLPDNPRKKTMTRKMAEKKRLKDRFRQQEYRASLSAQKKIWID